MALETPDGVVLGTDSFYGDAHTKGRLDSPKWILREQYALAFAGSLRSAQVISKIRIRPRKGRESEACFAQAIADAARKVLTKQQGEEPNLLIVVGSKVFMSASDYAVSRGTTGFEAIGSGRDFALAALHAIDKTQDGEAIVHRVLQIAADMCTTVCGPFHVRTL